MPGPLEGVRILDLTTMASGPLATSILADQGADVIKVEGPERVDGLRKIGPSRGGMSAIFTSFNRSKRAIAIDLRDERGVALLDRLVAGADVFVQNFRPGAVERMGIGAERYRAMHPELIYVSVSGFGERGPMAQSAVYDSVMQAYSGVAASQADPETGEPRFVQNIICDKGTALWTSQAITAALFARERGAGGQHLRLSMLHASVAFLWPDVLQHRTYLEGDDGGAGDEGATPPNRPSLPAIRRTADGFVSFAVIGDAQFVALTRALDRPDLAGDVRFADAGPRAMHAAELAAEVNPIVASMPTAEVAARLAREGVPHAIVNTLESLLEDEQLHATGVIETSEHPSAGPMRQPTPPARFDETPAAIRRPAPMLGEHTRELLAEAGLAEDEIGALVEGGVVEEASTR